MFLYFLSPQRPGERCIIANYGVDQQNIIILLYVKPWLFVMQELSESFKAYVAQRDYKLHTVADYGQILRKVGFSHVSNHKVLTYVEYTAVSDIELAFTI
jgi:hypothetical protein